LLDQHREVVVVFGLDEFCLLEAKPPEFFAAYTSTSAMQNIGRGSVSLFEKAVVSSRQNVASPKYNDDITLLI
jgi:hypothetical protein